LTPCQIAISNMLQETVECIGSALMFSLPNRPVFQFTIPVSPNTNYLLTLLTMLAWVYRLAEPVSAASYR
jgi:hypothetical protein